MSEISPITLFFSGEDYLCFFGQSGNIIFVTFIHIHRKYHISMYFLRKIVFHFPFKEKRWYFREKKKCNLFRYYKKDHIQVWFFFERPTFQNIWRKHYISMYLFWERSSFLFHLKNKSYFREKEISSFLIIQEKSYCIAIFLERPYFRNNWKKKILFFV